MAGNGDASIMEMRLAFVLEHRRRFEEVFGRPEPLMNDARRGISAFQRTIVSDPERVPFDRYAAGDEAALSESARRGLGLFRGEAGCVACHDGPLLSNGRFHAAGMPRDVVTETDDPLQMITVRWENYAKGVSEEVYHADPGDLDFCHVTKRPGDRFRFHVPSLRELVHTPPYMYNGTFETLEEVVEFYDAGGEVENLTPLLRPLGLSEQGRADLVEGYNDTVYAQSGRPTGVKGDDLSFTALIENGFIDVVQGSFVAVAIVSDEMRPGVSMANFDYPGSQANFVCHAVSEPVTGNYRYKLGRGILGRVGESPARCPRAFPRTSNCGTWTP